MSVSDTIDQLHYALRILVMLLMTFGVIMLVFDAFSG